MDKEQRAVKNLIEQGLNIKLSVREQAVLCLAYSQGIIKGLDKLKRVIK
jgi:hypothetical protein